MALTISAKLEDYLAVILKFQREKQFARVSDVAAHLDVAKSAVTAALRRLSDEGLINYHSYEPVTLTEAGEELGEEILLRHRIILDFLRNVLGIEGARASDIAGKMEHTVDPPALERFICFLAFIGSRPESGRTWLQEFRQFLQSGTGDQSCKECIQVYLDNVATEHHDER